MEKGKAYLSYEFGAKVYVSLAPPLKWSRAASSPLHTKARPENPYDGHTRKTVITDMERTMAMKSGRIAEG
ncbi:hypothetical protein [Mesorhizobium abyssinicae]|uniref:hypothetical protein n=1 Tax=Mesorhizobium abyssinicae TaxID=1209958 RepID=UPI003394D366